MINIQNFQQTDYTNAVTTTLSRDIKELKEKVAAIEAKITTDTDTFTESTGIESISDKKAVANACQETPQQDIKGKGLLPGIKTAATLITGFTTGLVIAKIAEETEKAIKESDKNNASSTKDNKENVTTSNVTTSNEVKPDAYAEKNTKELSSVKVKGFNVKSGELPDVDENGLIDSNSPIVIRHNIEKMIREYAKYDDKYPDEHDFCDGDVKVKFSEYDDFSETLVTKKYIDIKFDPESNILESFNMREVVCNDENDSKRIINTCSVEDKGNYILYEKDCYDWDYPNDKEHIAVICDKKTHVTTKLDLLYPLQILE